jgi:glutamate/aspartate transport system substrate-binding protein
MRLTKLIILAMALGGSAPANASESADNSPVLARIVERGHVTIGHRDASVPFSYLDSEGKPIGYSVDLCLKIVEGIREELALPDLAVKYVPVTSQTRIPLIANGTIDLECGSTTNNLRRQKQVDYLATTFITGAKIVTKKGSGIKDIQGLGGKVVGLSQGTTSSKNVQEAMEAANVNGEVLMVKDHSLGWLNLQNGRTDAYGTDDVILYGLISKSENPQDFEVVGDFLSFDPYAIMIQQNDSKFRRMANSVLVRLMRTREIHAIYDKWFYPGPTNINIEMSPMLAAAFEIQALPE